MQVTETLADGLKHEFQVTVPAADLEAKVADAPGRAQGPGPAPRLPARQGPGEPSAQGLRPLGHGRDHRERDPRDQRQDRRRARPQARDGAQGHACRKSRPRSRSVIGGKSDLAYTVAFEVLPKIVLADFKAFTLEKLTTEVSDAEIDEAVGKIAEQNRPYALKGEGAKVETRRPRSSIDFTGKIDGQPFEGGTGEDVAGHRRGRTVHSRLRGPAHRYGAGRDPPGQGDLPEQLRERGARRQRRGIRGDREVGRDPGRAQARR